MPTNHVITDASDIQWGALVNNDMIKGLWEQHQAKWHCNLKEMYAVIAAISAKAMELQNSTVILQSDNSLLLLLPASASPPTRPVQHRSRSPLTKSRRCRVAPHKRRNIETVRHVGHARLRPLCVTDSTCRRKLCFARLVRLEPLLSRRVQQILALPTCMAVPAAQPNIQGTGYSPQLSLRSVHSSSTQVDEAFLEARTEESCSETSRKTQKSGEDTGGHSDNATAGTSRQVTPGSLAHFGWDALTDTWTPQEKLSYCPRVGDSLQ